VACLIECPARFKHLCSGTGRFSECAATARQRPRRRQLEPAVEPGCWAPPSFHLLMSHRALAPPLGPRPWK